MIGSDHGMDSEVCEAGVLSDLESLKDLVTRETVFGLGRLTDEGEVSVGEVSGVVAERDGGRFRDTV